MTAETSLERWVGDQINAHRGGEWVARSVADEYLQRARSDGRKPAKSWLRHEIDRLTLRAAPADVGEYQLTERTK